MLNLLYKEFNLVIAKGYYWVLLLGALILIPNWLYFIAVSYVFFIGISNICIGAKTNKDLFMSSMLPVKKADIVKARIASLLVYEVLQILVAAVFAFINLRLYTKGGFFLDPNLAYFGFVLIMYSIFNIIFFPMYFKTCYKVGIPIIVAVTFSVLFATAVEFSVIRIPALNAVLDGNNGQSLTIKMIVLLVGIIIFLLSSIIAYKISTKRFEKLDL